VSENLGSRLRAALGKPRRDCWQECIGPKATSGIRDRRARRQTKRYVAIVAEKLRDPAKFTDLPQRQLAACQLMMWATDVWIDKAHAGRKRSIAHNAQRLAAGGAAAVAAGSGAALAAGLSGTAAKVWGLVVLGLGVGSGAAAAMWPLTDYERNRAKARQYEWLWRDMWAYLLDKVATDSLGDIAAKRDGFSKRMHSIT
jgi:hypothetical protein